MAQLQRPQQQTASTETWKHQLRQLLTACSSERLGIVGVGHPLRGDDYVGSYAVKAMLKVMAGLLPEGAYLFDAEDALEAIIFKLAKLSLKYVIFIDASEMGQRPGDVALLSLAETSYPFFATHGIPLKVLAERLLPDSEVWVLAIQPKQTEFNAGLSPEIRDTAMKVSEVMVSSLIGGGLPSASS